MKNGSTSSAVLTKGIATVLKFVRFTNRFQAIERLIWFKGVEGRERNGEHCYQLTLVAWFIIVREKLSLDLHKVFKYCIVHDLVETYAGDTPAFLDIWGAFESKFTHSSKKRREHEALKRIGKEWGLTFPDMIEAMWEYERRDNDESKFVYALDKLLSELNIYEDKGRTHKTLGRTLEENIQYKRPKIASFPFFLPWYDSLCDMARQRGDIFPPRSPVSKETVQNETAE